LVVFRNERRLKAANALAAGMNEWFIEYCSISCYGWWTCWWICNV